MINGVIEGFYGSSWPHESRLSYPSFLRSIGCNTYVYAPKADDYLRKQWPQPWPKAKQNALQTLAQACAENDIQFGMGLSPLGLMAVFDATAKQQLTTKLNSIQALGVSLLCLLFDDIPGDSETLAAQQVAICNFVEQQWQGDLVMCPTYYSIDPALTEYFGAKPNNYWPTLAQGLSPRWQIFWTGQQVVSLTYSQQELTTIAGVLGRKPTIWDNYPVNDGRLMRPFLNFSAPDRSVLTNSAAGVLHNPMNQSACSKLTLALMKGHQTSELAELLDAPQALIDQVLSDAEAFQNTGLEQFSEAAKRAYVACYSRYNHPVAHEVIAWLQDAYAFDPECLT